MLREATATLVRREDYAPPAFFIRAVELTFDLDPAKTIVASRLRIERNAAVPRAPLRLHGEELALLRVLADGQSVSFRHEGGNPGGDLVIDNPPEADSFTLELRNTCAPEKNTRLPRQVVGSTARTVAERGNSSRSAISPNTSPDFISPSLCSVPFRSWSVSTRPDRMMNAPIPVSPWRTMSCPGV